MSRRNHALSLAALLAAVVPSALADVQLIALPERERVEIQLQHPGLTLIEEERVIPLAQGANKVVFNWANAAVDKSSVQLRSLTDPDQVKVLSVAYPPNQNSVVWDVGSPTAGPAKVRISYVIGGIEQDYEYRAESDVDEKGLVLWQYVDVHNRTPEGFGEAGVSTGFGERLTRPIEANETRKMLAARYDGVPFRKSYTADLASFGWLDQGKRQLKIPLHYVIRNTALTGGGSAGLGKAPLGPGKVRIFQQDGKGGAAFLGEDWAPFAAKDDEWRLYVGVAKDVVVTRTIERSERKQVAGVLTNVEVTVKYEIENFKDQPVAIDIAESLSALRNEVGLGSPRAPEWSIAPGGTLTAPIADKSTAERVLFRVEAPPRGADQQAVKRTETFTLVFRNEW